MSLIASIDAELRGLVGHIAAAMDRLTAADRIAEEVIKQAALWGFSGVAQGALRLRESLAEIGGVLAGAAAALDRARAAVATAPGQPTPRQAALALTMVADHLATAAEAVAGAHRMVMQARRLVATVLAGGQPGPTLHRLDLVSQALTAATGQAGEVRRRVDATLTELARAGDVGPGKASSLPAAPSGHPIPDRVHAVATTLPDRPGGKGPTHGLLFDAESPAVGAHRLIRSAEDASLTTDLALDPYQRRSLSLRSHVEAHVARAMRRGTASASSVLVLNNRTCRGPLSCDALLPAIMPKGTTLTVYVTDGINTWLSRTYYGTGERIRS